MSEQTCPECGLPDSAKPGEPHCIVSGGDNCRLRTIARLKAANEKLRSGATEAMIRLGLSAQLLAASGQSQTSEFQRLRPALHPEEAQAVTDATPQPEHAPVLPRHRETAIDFLYPMHHLDRKSERADRQRFIDEGETKHVGKQCGALAQLIADAERSAVSEERAAVVKYLRDQAEYYRRNRNIGPYAAELAELFDRGDHRG